MKRFTVIFLADADQPKALLFLKRGDNRTFAPGYYTGPGGKVEAAETPHDGAVRELQEETGIIDINLLEFANLVINGRDVVHYFTAAYPPGPVPICPEGSLAWHPVAQIDCLRVIKSTRMVLEEWRVRGFSRRRQFSLQVSREDTENPESEYTSASVSEGLVGYQV